MDNLVALLVDHPAEEATPLLHTEDESRSAGAVRRAVRQRAEQLRTAGLQDGEAVGVKLTGALDTVEQMLGVWSARGVYVPINSRSPSEEEVSILERTGAAWLVDDDGVHQLDGRWAGGPDAAFVTWTSGTSGAPKAVIHTHSGYLELLDRVLGSLRGGRAGPGDEPTPNLVPVSLALNAGIYNVLFGLRAGAPLVLMDKFEPQSFARLVRRFGIRSTVLPPAAIASLAADESLDELAPLRYVRSITAPLSVPMARRFTERFGAFVLNGYGQAEVGEVIGWTAADARAHPDKLGAVGRPHAGVAVRIELPDGSEAPTGEVGTLRVRPPRMAEGYAGGGDFETRLDERGFLDTGDLACVDSDGFVWLAGRAGDVINRGGNKVYPDDVEAVLRRHPAVQDAAVVAAPDDRLGEVPVAILVCDPGVTDAQLERHCRDHLVAYKVPASFRRTGALPRNEVGKLLRSQLRATPTSQPPTEGGA